MARVITPSGDQVRTVYSSGGFAAGDYVFQTASGFEKAAGSTIWPISSTANYFDGVSNVAASYGLTNNSDLLLGPSQTGGSYTGSAITAYTQSLAPALYESGSNNLVATRLSDGRFFVYNTSATTFEVRDTNCVTVLWTGVSISGYYGFSVNNIRFLPMASGSMAVCFYDSSSATLRIIYVKYNGGNSYALSYKQADSNPQGGFPGYFPGSGNYQIWYYGGGSYVGCLTNLSYSVNEIYALKWNLDSSSGIYSAWGQNGQSSTGTTPQMTWNNTSNGVIPALNSSGNLRINILTNTYSGNSFGYFYDTSPATTSAGAWSIGLTAANVYQFAPPSSGCMFLSGSTPYFAFVRYASSTSLYLSISDTSDGRFSTIQTDVAFTASAAVSTYASTRVFCLGTSTTSNPPLAICYFVGSNNTPVMRIVNSPYTSVGAEQSLVNGITTNTVLPGGAKAQLFQFSPASQITYNLYAAAGSYVTGTYGLGLTTPQPFVYGATLTPVQTGTCVGVALTAASAGGTGKILVRGTAEVRSTLPNMPGALSFNHANYGTPGGIRGSVAGRTVTFEGIDG